MRQLAIRRTLAGETRMSGVTPLPAVVTYCASKAALNTLHRGPTADLRGLSIGTTLVELGPIATDVPAQGYDYEPTGKSYQRANRLLVAVGARRQLLCAGFRGERSQFRE